MNRKFLALLVVGLLFSSAVAAAGQSARKDGNSNPVFFQSSGDVNTCSSAPSIRSGTSGFAYLDDTRNNGGKELGYATDDGSIVRLEDGCSSTESWDVGATHIGPSGDFDGDGNTEILFADASNNEVETWEPATNSSSTIESTSSTPRPIDIVDFDNDNNQEAVYWDGGGNFKQVESGGSVTTFHTYGDTFGANFVGTADFDSDSDLDIAYWGYQASKFTLVDYNGNTDAIGPDATPSNNFNIGGVGDLDADNDPDLIHSDDSGNIDYTNYSNTTSSTGISYDEQEYANAIETDTAPSIDGTREEQVSSGSDADAYLNATDEGSIAWANLTVTENGSTVYDQNMSSSSGPDDYEAINAVTIDEVDVYYNFTYTVEDDSGQTTSTENSYFVEGVPASVDSFNLSAETNVSSPEVDKYNITLSGISFQSPELDSWRATSEKTGLGFTVLSVIVIVMALAVASTIVSGFGR